MKPKTRITALAVIVVLIGFGLVFVLTNFVQAHRPPVPVGYEDEDLALQGSRLKTTHSVSTA